MTKNRKFSLIAMLLISTFAVSLIALPSVLAQTAQHTKATHAVVGVKPNPVGVGQEVLIWLGISDPVALDVHGWQGLTVTVTKPDSKTETLGPFKTDSTGSTGYIYKPTMVGNYTFQTHFPEQTYTWPPTAPRRPFTGTAIYKASDSEIVTLTVQEDPIAYYPGVPLPTEYWTRPITSQFREWSPIAGNWANPTPPNFYAPYNDAPETGHVLWAKPLTTGGLVGGELGQHMYQTGDAYQGLWASSVIMNGILYYNRFQLGFQGGIPQQGIVAVDLRTGEELWFRNNTRLSHGQTVYWQNFNLYGTYPYLWEVVGTTWNAYDAYTGEYVYKMTNVPAGAQIYGPRGEILRYVVNSPRGWMALWNTTRGVSLEGWTVPQIQKEIPPMATDVARAEFAHGSWIPFGRTINDTVSYSWNVSIPVGLPGGVIAVLDDRVIGSNLGTLVALAPDPIVFWGISTAPQSRGTLLFNTTWANPPGNMTITLGAASLADKVFIIRSKEKRYWWAFSIDNGQLAWGPTASEAQLNIFDVIGAIAEGKFFSMGQSGILYAYEAKTGNKLWEYAVDDPYSEILWSNNWPMRILFISDGKIYLGQEEHSGNSPLPRGAPFVCINITTGEKIWSLEGGLRQNHWGGRAIIGDSIIATLDTYDNRIYALGKGPTATTVLIQDNVAAYGDSVLIQGTVADVSAGTKQNEITARFPNGVPAISDESMSEWMKYVYWQFPRPTDIDGVEVVLSVLDANNNFREIGRTTSDANGFYSLVWQPDIPGKYTVYASFTGSKAYWPSQAETAFVAAEEPPAPAEPEPAPPDMTDIYVLAGVIAIIIAIAIVGVVIVLVVRKRP